MSFERGRPGAALSGAPLKPKAEVPYKYRLSVPESILGRRRLCTRRSWEAYLHNKATSTSYRYGLRAVGHWDVGRIPHVLPLPPFAPANRCTAVSSISSPDIGPILKSKAVSTGVDVVFPSGPFGLTKQRVVALYPQHLMSVTQLRLPTSFGGLGPVTERSLVCLWRSDTSQVIGRVAKKKSP
ncbi:hypothetical protein LZ30DRAFT_290069 [Colletotrichum cereale]|nr:hypothetical protein LZ30DRAFT_290069 [Colletotrichum cereale]